MRTKWIYGAAFIMVLVFSACSFRSSKLDLVYELAGENRSELERVFEHYRAQPQKRKAAQFLIENMLHSYSDGKIVEEYRNKVMSYEGTSIPYDSLWFAIQSRAGASSAKRESDAATVTADYLIRNINEAFAVWEESPWYNDIHFEMFCHYILPFRVLDEPLSEWRSILKKEYMPLISGISDPKQAFAVVYQHVKNNFKERTHQYSYTPDVLLLHRQGEGICSHRCIYMISVLRSLGIPASYDLVHVWANYSQGGHSWVSYIDNEERTFTIDGNDSLPKEFNYIDASHMGISAHNDLSYFRYSIDSLKRASKVFRKTYALQRQIEILEDENIPSFFKDIFIHDVSNSYGLNNQVEVVSPKPKDTYLYTFASIRDWQPAASPQSREKVAQFDHLGGEIVYLPVYLENGIPHPIENPFILSENKKHTLNPETTSFRKIVLWRKYVLYGQWINRWSKILQGRIEASDFPDFRQSELLHEFTQIPDGITTIPLHPSKPYRYVRFLAREDARPNFAEITFWGISSHLDTTEMKGRIICDKMTEENVRKAFDKDYSTYCETPTDNYWLGLDFGEGNRMQLKSFEFCMRHDMNIIEVGDDYELFYYDYGWQSLGRRIADADSLVYDNAPDNALFWLKNHTKGREERIFTFENGKQIWW